MNEWLKVNAPLIAATMLLLSVLTLMRWELTARIETAEARMNTIRVEILAKLELLQKQFDTLDTRIGMKSPTHAFVEHVVAKGEQDHPLMMRHERADDGITLTCLQALGSEIHRFI